LIDGNDKYIKFFKALANEERIEIVKLLKKNEEMFAQDIERRFYLVHDLTSFKYVKKSRHYEVS
jgi:DNA-binding transcriptional ArsR family regulator